MPRKEILDRSLASLDLPDATTSGWLRQMQEPHRHYHTLTHIEQMLTHLAPGNAARELIAAIWLHDIVYDSKRPDNEEMSAEQARRDLRGSSIDADLVAGLILGTRTHSPGSDMQNLLNDLDLGILGASPSAYERYAGQIRQEYDWVPIAVYNPNRAALLKRFNERTIYQTKAFAHLEEQAHGNLCWEIERLEATS